MVTLHENAMLSNSLAFTFTCAARHYAGLLQLPSASDVDQGPVVPFSTGAEFTPFTEVHNASFPLCSVTLSLSGDWNYVVSHGVQTFGRVELKAVVASDVVSLKHCIAQTEGIQTTASVRDQETEGLARQVNELRDRVVSQEDRIACLERSRRAETELHKKMIQDLIAKVDSRKVDNDKKIYDDAIENLRQSFINLQWSMECQAARITGVKADTARKVALLQSELAGVHAEFAASKMVTSVTLTNQAAKKTQQVNTLETVDHQMEDVEMAQEKLRPLPPIGARSSTHSIASQAMPVASTSPGGSPNALLKHSKVEETTAGNLETTEEPLTVARADTRPSANKIPTKSTLPIPTILVPGIPIECHTLAKGSAKENKPCNHSTTTSQERKPLQSGAGRSLHVSAKTPTATPKKAQTNVGLLSKVSAMLKSRSSIPLAPRKSQYLGLPEHTAPADRGAFNHAKTTGNRPSGGSVTRMEQRKPMTLKCASIVASRSLSESALPTLAEKKPTAVLPASSSLTTLDTALQAMQFDGDDLLAPIPVLNYFYDDLSFSSIIPIPTITSMKTKQNRDDNYESVYIPSSQRKMDIKPLRSPLKSTLAEDEVLLPVSSSLTALETALQGEGDILTLLPGPDYPSVDFSFSAVTANFPEARAHYKRESIHMSFTNSSTAKPSRRL